MSIWHIKEAHRILSNPLFKTNFRWQKHPRDVDKCRHIISDINHIRHITNVNIRYRVTSVRRGQATIRHAKKKSLVENNKLRTSSAGHLGKNCTIRVVSESTQISSTQKSSTYIHILLYSSYTSYCYTDHAAISGIYIIYTYVCISVNTVWWYVRHKL